MKSNGMNFTKAGFTVLGSLLLLVVAGTTGCRGKLETTVEAGSTAQLDFATPDDAGKALQTAARADDEKALAKILGPDSKAILSSGDAEEDKAALASFVAKYDRMNRWVAMTDGSQVLYIGADNYPYPIALTQNASSRWYFDVAAGKDEVLARRIGKNEFLAINAISAMAKAEEAYFKHHRNADEGHEYAQKILSTPGTQDGLYWEVSKDQPASPLGRLNEFAQDVVASTKPGTQPTFDGYTFRILTAQGDYAKGGAKGYLTDGKMTGGFAILATPVTYGDSGVMSFMVGRDGVVYQKDLGTDTAQLAAYIFNYNPDGGWTLAE